jgi:threonine dehydrogenase-like Zn-dependent dehydrogenase
MARAFGGRQIIAVDISEGKLENAKKMGATHTVNGSTENVPERIRVSCHPCGYGVFLILGPQLLVSAFFYLGFLFEFAHFMCL